MELVTVGEAHEIVVPRGLKVHAPKPNFKSGGEGVGAAHGVPLGRDLSVNHHRDLLWGADLNATPLSGAPTVGAESSPDTN
jgi:hypothetical protein